VAPYGRQDITTDRVVGADRAQFNVNSYSGRIVACARDFNSDRFGSVPSVARRELRCEQAAAREAALLTASAEMKWPKSWAVAGTLQASSRMSRAGYAGKGMMRYAWYNAEHCKTNERSDRYGS